MNDKPKELYQILNALPKDMPFVLIADIASWATIYKSPYGHSYYSAPVGWDFKTHGSLRIADHWNFVSQSKKHCETTESVPDNDHYTIAQFDGILGKYRPIASYPKLTVDVKKTIDYKLLYTNVLRDRAITSLMGHIPSNINPDFYLARIEVEYAERITSILEHLK